MKKCANEPNPSAVGGYILIADYPPASLNILSVLLMGAGYSVRLTENGDAALLSVKDTLPNLILLDVDLPGTNGFDVFHRLQADSKTADVPIIFLSAIHDFDARIKGFRLGVVDYICKPYEPDEVIFRIRAALKIKHLKQRMKEMCDPHSRLLREEIIEHEPIELNLRESQIKLRELTRHLESRIEEERKRIAREIHDELGQTLTVARLDLTQLYQQLDQTEANLSGRISRIIGYLEDASDIARSISENLRPGMLDLLGLGPALEHHVQKFTETTGIHCTLTMSHQGEFSIDDEVAIAIFRIVQESLTNAARHANAQSVDIHVEDLGEAFTVIVQDNGKGIQPKSDTNTFSYGLLGMKERVKILGGHLLIESRYGNGTRIEAKFPYASLSISGEIE